jgi:hypothetical protein
MYDIPHLLGFSVLGLIAGLASLNVIVIAARLLGKPHVADAITSHASRVLWVFRLG